MGSFLQRRYFAVLVGCLAVVVSASSLAYAQTAADAKEEVSRVRTISKPAQTFGQSSVRRPPVGLARGLQRAGGGPDLSRLGEVVLNLLSDIALDLLSGNTAKLLAENQTELFSGNAPELLSGNDPALLSGNEAELLSGNETELLSGNKPKLLSNNTARLFSGNDLRLFSNIHLTVRMDNSGNNNGAGQGGPLPGLGRPGIGKFQKLDKDRDGLVSLPEFRGTRTAKKALRAQKRFALLDADQSGALTRDEFAGAKSAPTSPKAEVAKRVF